MTKLVDIALCLLPIFGILSHLGRTFSEKTRSNYATCANADVVPSHSRETRANTKQHNLDSFTTTLPSRKYEGSSAQRIPDGCSLVMADSSIRASGWGVFTLKTIERGESVSQGDPVIQIPDPNPREAHGMRRLLWDYLWDGQETGGQYEGLRVMSTVPGVGMVANGESNLHNVLPYEPYLDDAGLTRSNSPGAGAFTQYQNFTWYATKEIEAGGEIFVNYGEGWFRERGFFDQPPPSEKRSLPWLLGNGYCIDNLVPGLSTIAHAGHGAFAARNLEEASIVAPVPVLPLSSSSLGTVKQHESGRLIVSQTLMQNYCFGHKDSSLLLYPYSHNVNLVNHHENPNVELRWAESSLPLLSKPVSTLQGSPTRLLLELVALRPIDEGEEILLDYGREWVHAWEDHIRSWRPKTVEHVTARTMGNRLRVLRTEAELRTNPYPDNVFTSCYYNYNQTEDQERARLSLNDPSHFLWTRVPGLFESRNLRPCAILGRKRDAVGEHLYVVNILNRPGLRPSDRIPKGERRIVAGVPREAIQFSDKLYTTDQHLETAFRKELGLKVFPSEWKDLKR